MRRNHAIRVSADDILSRVAADIQAQKVTDYRSLLRYIDQNFEELLEYAERHIPASVPPKAPAPPPSASAPAPTAAPVPKPALSADTVEEAKASVRAMVNQLAELPPPDPENKDDQGFSFTTDRPLRAFLARLAISGDLPNEDYYRAALLLIEHSRTQLGRKRVMSAIRAFEKALHVSAAEVVPEDIQRAPKSAQRIYNATAGEISAPGTGLMRWSLSEDGLTVTLTIPTKKRGEEEGIDLREAAEQAKKVNRAAKMTRLQQTQYRTYWGLYLPVQTIPVVARYIGVYLPNYAAILMALWDTWKQVLSPEAIEAAEKGEPWPPIEEREEREAPPLDPRSGSIGFGLTQTKWAYDPNKRGVIEIAFPWAGRDRDQYVRQLERESILQLPGKVRIEEYEYTDKYGEKKRSKSYFYPYSTALIPAVIDYLSRAYPNEKSKALVISSLRSLQPSWRNSAKARRQ